MMKRLLAISVIILFGLETLKAQDRNPAYVGGIIDGTNGALLDAGFSVFISGNYAYVASLSNSALEIVDITNKSTPVHKGKITNGTGGALLQQAQSVYVAGNYAYIASSSSDALEIIDVTNPAAPFHKGSIVNGVDGAKLDGAYSVYVSGNYAYVASSISDALEIIDVSNPASPQHKGSISNGSAGALLDEPRSVFVYGNNAYIASYASNALEIIDVSNPTAPVHKGNIVHGTGGAKLASPRSVYVSGNYAYVACSGSGSLEIVDISNSTFPMHKSFVDGSSGFLYTPYAVHLSGNYAYVACAEISSGSGSLDVLDISNPATPLHVGIIATGTGGALLSWPRSIYISNNYAYITSSESHSLEIFVLFAIAPTALAASSIDQISFTANWSPVSGSTNYFIDVATDITFTSLVPGYINKSVTANTLMVTGLSPGTSYYYRIRSANAAGTSPDSDIITLKTIPADVTTLAPTFLTQTSFQANWVASAGATNYFLDVSTTSNFNSMISGYNNRSIGNATNYNVNSNLSTNTNYFYRIRASNSGGTSGSFNYTQILTIPATPLAISATAVNQNGFTANWNSITAVPNYFIDVSTDENFNVIFPNYNNKSVLTNSLVINDLSPGTTYYYQVRSANASGSSPSSTIKISQITVPPDPVTISPSSMTQTSFKANWASSTGATNYFLDVSISSSFNSFITGYQNLPIGNLTSYVVNLNLAINTNYYYRVRASNSAGVSGNNGFNSALTVTSTPISFTASTIDQTSFIANWNNVDGANKYFIDVSLDENFSNILSDHNNELALVNFFSIKGLAPATMYYYRVRSSNNSGSSPSSNIVSQLTLPPTPVGLAATGVTSSVFIANWDAVAGAQSYEVDVSKDNFVTFLSGYNAKSVTDNNNPITSLSPNTIYRFRIRSVNSAGKSPWATSPPIPTLDVSGNSVVTSGEATEINAISAKLNGTFNPNGVSSKVYFEWGLTSDLGSKTTEQILTGSGNQNVAAVVDGLKDNTTYYFQITATNTVETVSGVKNTFTTSKVAVSTGVASDRSINSVTLDGVVNTFGATAKVYFEWGTTTSLGNKTTEQNITTSVDQTVSITLSDLSGGTTYFFRIVAVSPGGTATGNNGTFTTLSPAQALSFAGTPSSIKQGTDVKLSASLQNGSGAKTVKLSYRSITSPTFKDTVITSSTNNYEVMLPSTKLDKVGLEYFFTASDATVSNKISDTNYIYTSVSQAIPNLSAGGQLENYRIISIPVAMSTTSPRTVFDDLFREYGEYNDEKWKVMHYEPGDPKGKNIDFTSLDKIIPGEGYWFNYIEKVEVNVSGTAVPNNQSAPFKLNLKKGWNQIGNPYTFNISWSDVLAQNPDVKEAGTKFYEYDASKVSFRQNDIITAWSGGFIKVTAACSLKIPVTVKQTTGGRQATHANEIENHQLDQAEWFLPIHLSQGDAYNEMGGIGMHPDASLSNDRYDEQSLPRFQNYLEFNSYHPEFFLQRFTRDVVPTSNSYTWDYTIESNFGKSQATLTWDEQSLGSNDAQLKLYDEEAGELIDMKRVSSYSFTLSDTRKIRIFYSADEKSLAPDISGMGKPYPNPFSQQVTVPFFTGSNSPYIQIVIYDLTGRKVKELINQKQPSGFYQLTWDGNDEQGNRVANGVYLYRFTSSDSKPLSGRLVIK